MLLGICIFYVFADFAIVNSDDNSPIILPYIVGDSISGNLTWNTTDFNTSQIELLLTYKKGENTGILSFGMINNTGSLQKDFTPNFTSNAQALLIPNNATGIFELKSSNKKPIKLNKYKYILFQSIILTHNGISGFTLSNDQQNTQNTQKTNIILTGMIAQKIFTQKHASFTIRLSNITDNNAYNISYSKSLNILYQTKWSQTCTNISIIGSKNVTYCAFQVNFTNEFEDKYPVNITSGYYLLSILFTNNSVSNNFFAINAFLTTSNMKKIFVYSSKNVLVNVENVTNGVVNISAYEERDIHVYIDDLSGVIYAILEDINNAENNYIFDCMSHFIEYYDSFGWRFKAISNNNVNIINGMYLLKLYMDYGENINDMVGNEKYMIYTNKTIRFNVSVLENDITNIISVNNKDNTSLLLKKGESESFEFISSVNNGTIIDVYFEQCNKTINGTILDCNEYYGNNDGVACSFEYDIYNLIEIIEIPNNKSLRNDDGSNAEIVTNIVMNITLCDGVNVITTKQNISIMSSSSSDNDKLGQDVVVGIICGVSIVFGLLVWLCCLRHKENQSGYQNLIQ